MAIPNKLMPIESSVYMKTVWHFPNTRHLLSYLGRVIYFGWIYLLLGPISILPGFPCPLYHISGIMVNMLNSSVVDGQLKF